MTAIWLLGSEPCQATTIIVPDDSPTVQGGLDLLSADDTLLVRQGTYIEALVAPGIPFVMLGEFEPDSGMNVRPTIDATTTGTPDSVPLLFLPEGSQAFLVSLLFRNTNRTGVVSMGAGIQITDCVFESTFIGFKFDLNDAGTQVAIQRCRFHRNFERCVVVRNGNRLLMTDCELSGAGSEYGRALVSAGESVISSCWFIGDVQPDLLSLGSGPHLVTNCTFSVSTAILSSIPVEVRGGALRFLNNEFLDCVFAFRLMDVQSGVGDSVEICDNRFIRCHGPDSAITAQGVLGVWAQGESERGPLICGNTFTECYSNGFVDDIALDPSSPYHLEGNSFERDSINGIPSILAGNPSWQPAPVTLWNNSWTNCGYAVALSAAADARNNYWGHSSGPYHETTNPFGQGDTITGDVPFIPWLEDSTDAIGFSDAQFPQDFQLTSYPNPFNATVTLEFTLTHEQTISLGIFDLLGRQVESLSNERVPAGTQRITWNAQAQSSGIYFARLSGSAPAHSTTSKLLLLK